MKTIFKYPLEVTDDQEIEVPECFNPLSVQVQRGSPCLWAEVDPGCPRTIKRQILIVGTGHPLPDDHDVWDYIGTFQMYDGELVFHAYWK